MKIRRFDRRTFVRNTLVNNAAARARLEMRVVPIDKVAPAERTEREQQVQAQPRIPQDR